MKMQREFTTAEGRRVELLGAPAKVAVYIDGVRMRVVNGRRKARIYAVDYSRRHGSK